MTETLTFEQKAKIQMIKKNLTLQDIADELGISKAYVSDILKGNRNPEDKKQQIIEFLEIE